MSRFAVVTSIGIGLLLGLAATVDGSRAPAPAGILLYADYGGFPSAGIGDGVPGLYRVKADGTSPRPLRGSFYLGEAPDWSPDGRRIVFSRWLDTEDARSSRYGLDLVVAGANGTGPRVLVAHTDALPFPMSPAWSPDGRRIGFVSSGPNDMPQIFITNASFGPSNNVRRVSGTQGAASVSWSPAGDELVFDLYTRPSGVYRISSKGGKRQLLVTGAHAPSWSPDGRHIAYLADRGGLYVLNVQTGRSRLVTHACTKASGPTWSPDNHWLAFADCLKGVAAPRDPRALTVVRTDGSDRRVVLSADFGIGSPSWH